VAPRPSGEWREPKLDLAGAGYASLAAHRWRVSEVKAAWRLARLFGWLRLTFGGRMSMDGVHDFNKAIEANRPSVLPKPVRSRVAWTNASNITSQNGISTFSSPRTASRAATWPTL
jgi:hypothetical protein